MQAKPHLSNFLHEVTFGVVGLFTEPIQGAKKHGEHPKCGQQGPSSWHSLSAAWVLVAWGFAAFINSCSAASCNKEAAHIACWTLPSMHALQSARKMTA